MTGIIFASMIYLMGGIGALLASCDHGKEAFMIDQCPAPMAMRWLVVPLWPIAVGYWAVDRLLREWL